jgi:hypothetical protein
MRAAIKHLRATLPPLLTVRQYCDLTGRSQASAYNDMRDKPGIAVKVGGSTRFITDAVLAELLPWVPEKDRAAAKKPRRPRSRQTGEART